MPHKPPRPCSQHPWLLVADGDDCPVCATYAGQPSLKPERVDTRPSAARRGYGKAHQLKRERLIKQRMWCDDPFRRHSNKRVRGVIRDHRTPLSLGGTDDESNEQLLCTSCHNYKTAHDGSKSTSKGV